MAATAPPESRDWASQRGENGVTASPHPWAHLASLAWIIFLGYWFVSAQKLKTVKQREPSRERIVYIVFMVTAYLLMFSDALSAGCLGRRFLPSSGETGALGVALSFVGVALAIWARGHLGQNWSATVTLKEGHELICTGPYQRIRHPIYTGMLTGLAGMAVALGEYRGLLGFAIATSCFFAKARKEERYLLQEFGARFQENVRRTGMFLPKWTGG